MLSVNLRRLFFVGYEALTRSTLALMLQILDYKIEMEKTQPSMKTEEVAASYIAHMKELDSNIEETITANFVAAAIRVFNKMLRSPRIMELLVAEENERGKASIFNSSSVLDAFAKAAKDEESSYWLVKTVLHRLASGDSPKDYGIKSLTGKGTGAKGDLQLWLMKLDLQRYFEKWMSSETTLRKEDIKAVTDINSHDKFLLLCGPDANISWQGTLSKAGRLLLQFKDHVIYGTRLDATLKQLLKAHADAASLCSSGVLKELLEEILSVAKSEVPEHQVREERAKMESIAEKDAEQEKLENSVILHDLQCGQAGCVCRRREQGPVRLQEIGGLPASSVLVCSQIQCATQRGRF